MKVRLNGVRKVYMTGEYIKLGGLLKLSSVASTGGEAKLLIQSGEVFVDGKQCIARGRKVRPGDIVRCGAETLIVERAKTNDRQPRG